MESLNVYFDQINQALQTLSTEAKAISSQRYFPNGIQCMGANAADIKIIIQEFHREHSILDANEILEISEYLLKHAKFNEQKLLAFGLINKFVKRQYDDKLLERFEFWLENYADNWSLVDDLCIKTIYSFFLSRPYLINKTQHWAKSKVPWCRRAGNVVWVKFIHRKIGKSFYSLDKELIFKQCDQLIEDEDEFVQKSIAWLLKVTSVHHKACVLKFLQKNIDKIQRSTLRYAIEKMDVDSRNKILSL